MELPEILTYEQAAARYGCDRQAIRKAILAGKIKTYQPGRVVKIDLESADQWYLNSGHTPSPSRGAARRRRY